MEDHEECRGHQPGVHGAVHCVQCEFQLIFRGMLTCRGRCSVGGSRYIKVMKGYRCDAGTIQMRYRKGQLKERVGFKSVEV